MTDIILDVQNMSKRYGAFAANTDISVSVGRGTIHGVIGPNGAGKTTFFNCLAGKVRTTSGSALLDGRDILRLPQHARPGLGIGRSFQVTSLFPELTVLENLRLAGQALHPSSGFVFWHHVHNSGPDVENAGSVISRIGLRAAPDTLVGELSHGEQRLLEFGMALMARPKLLLLDEPTSGMGIDDVPNMTNLLRSLRGECTVLLIEHNIQLVVDVCDRITVLQSGRVICEGTPAEVSENEAVKTAYLGEGF